MPDRVCGSGVEVGSGVDVKVGGTVGVEVGVEIGRVIGVELGGSVEVGVGWMVDVTTGRRSCTAVDKGGSIGRGVHAGRIRALSATKKSRHD